MSDSEKAPTSKSMVNSMGNIGSVARDESFNFNTQSFGDVINNGIGNSISPASNTQGEAELD
jgi:hypothetical protein